MHKKFMKFKKVVLPVVSLVLLVSQLSGCAGTGKEELSSLCNVDNPNEAVEVYVEELDGGTKSAPEEMYWTQLSQMSSNSDLRGAVDIYFMNTADPDTNIKYGPFFVDKDGNQNGNNTLLGVLGNKIVYNSFAGIEPAEETTGEATEESEDTTSLDTLDNMIDGELNQYVQGAYTDITADEYREALINAYFELLPDDDTFNGNLLLSKAESMAMVMRAITPVKSITATSEFEEAVKCEEGSIYNTYIAYAEPMADYIYTTASGKNLYAENFSGAMTRGEFIYMVINAIYGVDELATYNPSEAGSVNDCEKGVAWGLSGEGERDKALNLAINSKSTDENKGKAPEEIYRAVAFANENGIIGSESRWESNISKSEAIEILVNTILSYYEANPDAMYDQANGGSTEMLEVAGKALWDKQDKNDMSCTEEEFIADYVEMLASGATEEQFAEGITMDYSIKWAEEEAKRIEEAQKKAEEEAKKAEEEAAKQEEQQEVVYDEPDYSYEEEQSYYEEPVVEEYNEPVYEEPVYEDNSGSSGGGFSGDVPGYVDIELDIPAEGIIGDGWIIQ